MLKKYKYVLRGFLCGLAASVVAAVAVFFLFFFHPELDPNALHIKMQFNSTHFAALRGGKTTYCFEVKDTILTCYIGPKEEGDVQDIPYLSTITTQHSRQLTDKQLSRLLSLAKELEKSGYSNPGALSPKWDFGEVQFWYNKKVYATRYSSYHPESEVFQKLINEIIKLSPARTNMYRAFDDL